MERDYANIIDYARTQLDTFDERELCRADSLVFSCIAYFRLPQANVAIRDLYRADWFDRICGPVFDPQSSYELLCAVAASPRFRDVWISDYVSHTDERAEQQFSAMTFEVSPNKTFVAFRGTDNTIVGWKEDFNMAFATAVPSQVTAVQYVEAVAQRTNGKLWLGGHSKGGNLAVYAGMNCSQEVGSRLVRLFTHDGPGFMRECMVGGRWDEAASLIDKTIPQSSVIGMLFEYQEPNFSVVHSRGVALSQHDPYSWEIDGCDFVLEERVGLGASHIDSSIDALLASTSPEKRERVIDAVFGVLGAAGVDTMGDIKRGWRESLPKMLAAASELPAEDRQIVLDVVGNFMRIATTL